MATRPEYWSWSFLFMVPSWSHLQSWSPTWLSLPLPSWPQMAPHWLLGTLSSPPKMEVLRGGYGFSETPPRILSLVFTQGKGCVWQKQLYKCGCGDRSSRVTWRVC